MGREIEQAEVIGMMRKRRITSWAVDTVILAAMTAEAVWATRGGGWVAPAAMAVCVIAFAAFRVWANSGIVHLDRDGQPLTGRDADRLRQLWLRTYEKKQRRCQRMAR